jgi:hypothetical protein
MNEERDFTLEELRDLKIAVTRAMDTTRPSETELYDRFEALYQKLRNLGA